MKPAGRRIRAELAHGHFARRAFAAQLGIRHRHVGYSISSSLPAIVLPDPNANGCGRVPVAVGLTYFWRRPSVERFERGIVVGRFSAATKIRDDVICNTQRSDAVLTNVVFVVAIDASRNRVFGPKVKRPTFVVKGRQKHGGPLCRWTNADKMLLYRQGSQTATAQMDRL